MVREMKDSGIEWIGEIPREWEVKRVKNCISDRTAGNWGEDEKNNEDDFICIRVADFDYERMRIKKANNYTKRNYNKTIIKKLLLKENDILIEKSGGGEKTPVGRTIIFKEKFPALYANFIERLRVNFNIVNPMFLQYLFVTFYKNKYILNYIKQTTGIQNLDITSMLTNERIVLPPLEEQEKIANYLDKKVSDIDLIIEKTKITIEDYKKYKQSIITEAVTKGINPNVEMKDSGIEWIGQIPKHWEFLRIQNLFEVVDRRNVNPKAQLLSLYTAIGVRPRADLEEKGNKAVTVINYKIVEKNDIIVNKLLAWMGAIAYSDYEGVTSPDYDVYRAKESKPVNRNYFNNYFRYTQFKGDCFKYGYGIMLMRWRTYSEQFLRLKVPVPPLEEQQQIADYLDKKVSEVDNLIAKKESLISEMEEYKKSLIYECVTGKKEVSENV